MQSKKIAVLFCLLAVSGWGAGLLDKNDQTMNGKWTFNKDVTVAGTTTLNGALVTTGAITASGAQTFAAAVSLDDGSGDSPILTLQCAGDKTLALQKLDAGGATLTNNEGAINLLPSNDTDDYITIATASNVPSIATLGACDLDLAPMAGLNIKTSGDADDYISILTTSDVPAITTLGSCALDLAPMTALNIKTSADADDYIAITTASDVPVIATLGSCALSLSPMGALNIIPSGDTDDYLAISTVSNVPVIATLGACDLKIAPMGALNFVTSGDADDYLIVSTSGNVPLISTSNTSNLNINPSGGQTNFTGTVIASGNIWAYDGAGNSPEIQVTDGDVKSMKLSKLDAGDGLILCDEGGLQLQLSNDTDDYLLLSTAANVPTIATAGTSNLAIAPDGGTTAITGNLTVTGSITGGSYVSRITQTVAFGAFTDNTDATGYIDLTAKLPAGSLVLGWRAVVTTGFSGDTTAVVQVGKAGALSAYSTSTSGSVLAAGTVGSASVLATSFEGAETTVRVTVTGGADFTSITAGEMTITVFYAY